MTQNIIHNQLCNINKRCAVIHTNGICPDVGKCNCQNIKKECPYKNDDCPKCYPKSPHPEKYKNKNMNKITKEQVLENIEEVKKYIQEINNKKEEKVIGVVIKNRFTGSIIFQSTKTTYKDAVNEYVEESKNKGLRTDLTDADLIGADLTHTDLTGANLIGADLTGADLTDADLTDADLTDADLTGADLTGANLAGCKFYMGNTFRNFEALCKAIKTIRWNNNTGKDFIN